MRARVSTESVAIGLACVVAVTAVFVFLHTGSRAAALCARDGAAVSDGLSWWPPGTRCSGGEPVRTTTTFDPLVGLVVPGVALLVFGGAALTGRRRSVANEPPRPASDGATTRAK